MTALAHALKRTIPISAARSTVFRHLTDPAQGPDGQPRGAGTSVFDLASDGRIARVVGFWK